MELSLECFSEFNQGKQSLTKRTNLKPRELSTTIPEMPFTIDLCEKFPVGALRFCAVSFCAIISHPIAFQELSYPSPIMNIQRNMRILFKGTIFLSIWTLHHVQLVEMTTCLTRNIHHKVSNNHTIAKLMKNIVIIIHNAWLIN